MYYQSISINKVHSTVLFTNKTTLTSHCLFNYTTSVVGDPPPPPRTHCHRYCKTVNQNAIYNHRYIKKKSETHRKTQWHVRNSDKEFNVLLMAELFRP